MSRINYERAVSAAGGAPYSYYAPLFDHRFDGLLLAGGGDVLPTFYGQENHACFDMDLRRDTAELDLIRAFLAAKKPIFGICRGLQILNIFFDGTLLQDLPGTLNDFHRHGPQGDRVHPVRAQPGSLLEHLYGITFSVTSAHHQAIDTLAFDLRATAHSESGLVEGVEHFSLPVFAVQFHPERMTGSLARHDTTDGAALFSHFIHLCASD